MIDNATKNAIQPSQLNQRRALNEAAVGYRHIGVVALPNSNLTHGLDSGGAPVEVGPDGSPYLAPRGINMIKVTELGRRMWPATFFTGASRLALGPASNHVAIARVAGISVL